MRLHPQALKRTVPAGFIGTAQAVPLPISRSWVDVAVRLRKEASPGGSRGGYPAWVSLYFRFQAVGFVLFAVGFVFPSQLAVNVGEEVVSVLRIGIKQHSLLQVGQRAVEVALHAKSASGFEVGTEAAGVHLRGGFKLRRGIEDAAVAAEGDAQIEVQVSRAARLRMLQ